MGNIIIGIKKQFAYRTEVIFALFTSVLSILVQIALWRYLYQEDNNMMLYMVGYVICTKIIAEFYSNRIYYLLSDKIQSGDFVMDLLRPTNVLWLSYLRALGEIIAQVVLRVIPLGLMFWPILHRMITYRNFLCFLVALLFGHILFILIYAIIGFSSFVFVESWSLRRLMDDTILFISGSLLPLALFPEWLRKIAYVLPFHYLYDFPLNLLLKNDWEISFVMEGLAGIGCWILILFSMLVLIYKIAIRYCTVQGG